MLECSLAVNSSLPAWTSTPSSRLRAGMTVALMRLEQRGAVAFTLATVAIVVILLSPCGDICSKGSMTKKPVKPYTVDASP
jgi:hypothetical protein